ncbi:MAG: hypothetical protein FJZ63_04025 [Chlamydiae bacterium]|nr:hypothetical protein [Chlamydiota bacterium]
MRYWIALVLSFNRPAFSDIPRPLLDENAILFLEEQIPKLAAMACELAYWNALASGSCVLVAKNGLLIEISPDGTERIIKELPHSIPTIPGKYLKISIEPDNDS